MTSQAEQLRDARRVSGCPNSTAGGCRCPEHHPGLGVNVEVTTPPVRLRVVTPGPPARSAQEIADDLLKQARTACPACQGDANRCNNGNGPPNFGRLHGCRAWTAEGDLAALRARPAPAQPWDPKPARVRAA